MKFHTNVDKSWTEFALPSLPIFLHSTTSRCKIDARLTNSVQLSTTSYHSKHLFSTFEAISTWTECFQRSYQIGREADAFVDVKHFPSAYVGHAEQKTDMVSTNMMKGINRLTPDHQQVLFGLLASCFSSQTGSKQRGLRCWNLCVVLCLCMPQFSIFPITMKQFFMAAVFDDLTLIKYKDMIAKTAGR